MIKDNSAIFKFKIGDKVRYLDEECVGIVIERRTFCGLPSYIIRYPEGDSRWCSEKGYHFAGYVQLTLF